MRELLLVVTIADKRVALRAADVHSVIELEMLTPVPRAAGHVPGGPGAATLAPGGGAGGEPVQLRRDQHERRSACVEELGEAGPPGARRVRRHHRHCLLMVQARYPRSR